ncbi:hypothetical protein FACS189465_1830 [Clostridia bacterium]|nr:hypothetical protein FACS189465_1830 [Clostridia bacterium]
MFFFNIFGKILGYLLWFFFGFFGNYTVSIFFVILAVTILMIPFAINRQKAVPLQARLFEKQSELKKKCGKDYKKYNEELAKLYEKEKFSPASGCLPMLLPVLIFSGVTFAISRPLENVLLIKPAIVDQVVKSCFSVPNDVSSEETLKPIIKAPPQRGYEQLQVVKFFPEIKEDLTMVSVAESDRISSYRSGFDLLGLNLLDIPKQSSFASMLWIIPALSILCSMLSLYFMQKTNVQQQPQQKGLMRVIMFLPNLIFGYMTFTLPAAVGIYWIINSIINTAQVLLLTKIYNKFTINAREEAATIALLESREMSGLEFENNGE